MRICPKFKILI